MKALNLVYAGAMVVAGCSRGPAMAELREEYSLNRAALNALSVAARCSSAARVDPDLHESEGCRGFSPDSLSAARGVISALGIKRIRKGPVGCIYIERNGSSWLWKQQSRGFLTCEKLPEVAVVVDDIPAKRPHHAFYVIPLEANWYLYESN